MKIKIYLFRAAVLVTAFVFGTGVVSFGQYFQSVFSAKIQNAETIDFAPVETSNVQEITFSALTASQTEIPVSLQTENKEDASYRYEFDAAGGYYIIGDLPKGFKDFDALIITTEDYAVATAENGYNDTAIPPEGYISTTKEFKFVRINIGVKKISWETEKKNGTSYKFTGEFIDGEPVKYTSDLGYEYTDVAVLKGNLIKMRNGKKIAESKVSFAIGGC